MRRSHERLAARRATNVRASAAEAASRLKREQGTNILLVSRVAGVSRPSVMLDVYGHLLVEGRADAATRDSRIVRIDDPELVRREYATEQTLVARNRTFRDFAGVDAPQVVLDAVAEVRPDRVLEVGCGTGELAERMQTELGVEVIAIDLSPRMVELTSARSIDARVGDVQQLQFEDGVFDVVVAAWMLYHVPDLDLALREIRRALRPGGRLVAATFGEDNLAELWELLGDDSTKPHSFTAENAPRRLARWFRTVERRDASGVIVFPNRGAVHDYVSASIRRSHLADRIPDFDGPLSARSSQAVYIAEAA